jgi:diketogulonate reductase-like aldo/keto reductase
MSSERSTALPQRVLGRTGERVSIIGLGGYHIGQQDDQNESIRLIRTAIDRGITFMDNCWDYNDGASETRMGLALQDGYRERVFLMTKIDGRDRGSATVQIDESLRRLKTDVLDLLQFHENIRPDDADRIFAPGGALEAAVAARDAGKVRYIGFTGHKSPALHLHMLDVAQQHGFTFDSVQMPINVMDAHYESFTQQVVPVARERGAAILGMKTFGDHWILKSNTVDPIDALHFSMNVADIVITGIDSDEILAQAIRAAETFVPLAQSDIDRILAKTAGAAKHGEWEHYKTTGDFDWTAQNPWSLGAPVG